MRIFCIGRTGEIIEYNKKFIDRRLNPENGHRYLPYIVVLIDEFADLIMTAGKEVETPIARLAQLARAIGIHLIVATQRPSVNVITGIIKANFPARIAFRVTSKIDSRTILDAGGADQLIGRGDLLYTAGNEIERIQCAFVDTPEVEKITLPCSVTPISGLLLEITNSALDVEIKLKGTDKSVNKYSEANRDSIVAVGRGSDPLITRALSVAASPTLMIVYPSTVTESLICRGAFK